jgi:hypothetical protein
VVVVVRHVSYGLAARHSPLRSWAEGKAKGEAKAEARAKAKARGKAKAKGEKGSGGNQHSQESTADGISKGRNAGTTRKESAKVRTHT